MERCPSSTFRDKRFSDWREENYKKNCKLTENAFKEGISVIQLIPCIQARMSRGFRFLLFLHHKYQVSLKKFHIVYFVFPICKIRHVKLSLRCLVNKMIWPLTFCKLVGCLSYKGCFWDCRGLPQLITFFICTVGRSFNLYAYNRKHLPIMTTKYQIKPKPWEQQRLLPPSSSVIPIPIQV